MLLIINHRKNQLMYCLLYNTCHAGTLLSFQRKFDWVLRAESCVELQNKKCQVALKLKNLKTTPGL